MANLFHCGNESLNKVSSIDICVNYERTDSSGASARAGAVLSVQGYSKIKILSLNGGFYYDYHYIYNNDNGIIIARNVNDVVDITSINSIKIWVGGGAETTYGSMTVRLYK